MNANYSRVPTEFAPEIRFDVTPVPVAPFRATLETRFDHLKEQLLMERLGQLKDRGFNSQVRRAANEAAALALVTPYPLLLFPSLFEERTQKILDCDERENQVAQPGLELLVA